jgi:hypothetical protein
MMMMMLTMMIARGSKEVVKAIAKKMLGVWNN